MAELIRSETRTARKHHACDAFHWFEHSNYGEEDFEPDDWLVIQGAIADRGRILPGQQYLFQVSKDGGDLIPFRGRLDMVAICHKYDLFPED